MESALISSYAKSFIGQQYYFLVNDKRIYLRDIEFYYHEEGEHAKIKDYGMYHIADKMKDDKKDEYFLLGSPNAYIAY